MKRKREEKEENELSRTGTIIRNGREREREETEES